MGVLPPDEDEDEDAYDHERAEQEVWQELEDKDDYPPENLADCGDD